MMNSFRILKDQFLQIPGCNVQENVPMNKYTSFQIGGPADLFVEPSNCHEFEQVLHILSNTTIPYFILGKGSNILVGDLGIRGVVISMSGLDQIQIEGTKITVGAGASLGKVAVAAMQAKLTGLEFASGIPGSIGGAVVMNAGAYGGEIKDVLVSATAFTPSGEKKILKCAEIELSYRHSIFHDNNWIVAEVELQLQHGDPQTIKEKMVELNSRRKAKQPLEFPSAGSSFKRPPGYYAGTTIDQAGLKGYSVGGAQVSEKHAGFIINTGKATAQDVARLIKSIQEIIQDKVGIELEPEIRFVGEFKKDN